MVSSEGRPLRTGKMAFTPSYGLRSRLSSLHAVGVVNISCLLEILSPLRGKPPVGNCLDYDSL